jgi:hypothetical protein
MVLKATGMVISSKTKLLIVGDSVMRCFSSAGDGDASPGSGFIYWSLRSVFGVAQAAMRPNTLIRAGSFAGPFLYQLRVLCYPERYAKTEALMVEAAVFQAPSNFAMF